ncbi:hypothetical protein JAB5_17410 [Janthinobacterium sp. HH103]|nr:hypothetical protein JAB5_17410 [Janthinobacterium sp. HH103]
MQAQHGQAVEQVGAEASFADALLQVAMRGADDAHVDGDGPRAAHAHHFALFQHAQQPRLQGQRHFADFVEEQGAVVGRFEQPRMAAPARAREGPILVAEQFRFQQGLGDGAAIDGDKGPVRAQAARAFPVDGLRHQFLAAARLALDQDRRRRPRIQHHRLAQRFHRLRFAAQIVQAVARAQGVGHHRAPPPVRFDLGQARQFQRVVEGAPDGRGRIHEDGGQARFFGQVGDEARADDGFDALGLQFIDLRARVFLGGVGALRDLEAEGGGKFAQFRHRVLVGDDADVRRDAPRARQRLHHVVAAGLGDDDGYRQPAFQVGAVGTGRNDGVAALRGHAFADVAHGVVEAQVDRLDRRQVVVFERDVAEQVEQPRDGDGPDDGFVAVVERRLGRAAHALF